jgi:fructose-1,6-bisphosphatase I
MDKHRIVNTDPVTLTRYLINSQKEHNEATGDFTLLLTSIQTACKFISSKVRKAGIANLYGIAGGVNMSGDTQKKLDVLSNEVFINVLKASSKCCILASEEDDDPIEVDIENQGKYVVCFDPLDGSSNIDANVSIGSIYAIWKKVSTGPTGTIEDLLQKGDNLIAAGYCLYGTSTQMVLALADGPVNGFTLDPSLGEFILTHPDIRIPKRGVIYSINEGNAAAWEEPVAKYIHSKKFPAEGQKGYSLRYIGSMVADVHRTLLYGGIFMYPADKKAPNGKLRVLYEVFPMAYIVERAGGKASNGYGRVLTLQPKKVHERVGIILGSSEDVDDVEKLHAEFKASK